MAKTDYNKDGAPDLYIGQAPHHVPGTEQSGGTYVFNGRDGALLKALELPASGRQHGQASNMGPNLGWGLAAPGDMNGDGEPDYVGAAPFTDVGTNKDQGVLYAFMSRPTPSPPGTTTPPGFSPIPAALVLSRTSVTPNTFRVSAVRTPRGRRRPRPVGTRVRFTLSRAASVRMTVELRTLGRRVRTRVGRRFVTRCLAATRARRRLARCTRFVSRGFITFTGRAGANSVRFNGRVRGRALPAGVYRATLQATDSAGRRSNSRTVSFIVVRR